jgi:hypothetical protein
LEVNKVEGDFLEIHLKSIMFLQADLPLLQLMEDCLEEALFHQQHNHLLEVYLDQLLKVVASLVRRVFLNKLKVGPRIHHLLKLIHSLVLVALLKLKVLQILQLHSNHF